MIFTIVLYVLFYFFAGFMTMAAVIKCAEVDIEEVKENFGAFIIGMVAWPLMLVIAVGYILCYIIKITGLGIFKHIFKIPFTNQPPVSKPMHPAEDPPVEKVMEETTGNFDFMDLE